jgi:hypothetical protein
MSTTHTDNASSTVDEQPIDRFLALLKGCRKSSRGYLAHCPGPTHRNGDSNPSLSIWEDEDDRHVGLRCYAGCTRKDIVESLDITEQDLYVQDGSQKRRPPRPVFDVCDLMVAKIIHPALLQQWGVHDGTAEECTFYSKKDGKPYVSKGVVIPYFYEDGTPYERYRIRHSLAKKPIWNHWDEEKQGKPPATIPLGLNYLDEARKRGYLVKPEGESDWMTLKQHGFPVLALPGASNYKCIKLEYLRDIDRVYILQEPDEAGRQLPDNLYKHLKSLGYRGKVYAVDLYERTGCKDPSELQEKIVKEDDSLIRFKSVFQSALDNARPLFFVGSKPTIARLRDLQSVILPDTRWSVSDVLPEGLTLLVGKPKLGKSWLLLAVLIGISNGTVVLGTIPVEAGEVLYISLEDNDKRLQRRTNTLSQQIKVSERFYYATEWARLNEGGEEQLEEFILTHPNLRIIGIDTWARIKPKMRGRTGQQYDEDYDALTPLQQLANKHSISIVVVHHMRKQESNDPLDMISGSTAMQGAVDGFLVLYRKRGETGARLYVTGRDIEEEQELLLTFNQECATWTLKGSAEENAGTPERQSIIDAMREYGKPIAMKELANRLEKNYHTVRNLVASLRNEGKIILQNNLYSLVSLVSHSNTSNPSQRSQEAEKDDLRADYDATSLTRADYGSIVNGYQGMNKPAEPFEDTENTPLTTLTRVVTDNDKINRDIAIKLLDQLYQSSFCHQDRIYWEVPGSQFSPGLITVNTYKVRAQKCIESGGDRLFAILTDVRHKVVAYCREGA